MTNAPVTPGIVATPVISPRELKMPGKSRKVTSEVNRAEKELTKQRIVVGPKEEISTES